MSGVERRVIQHLLTGQTIIIGALREKFLRDAEGASVVSEWLDITDSLHDELAVANDPDDDDPDPDDTFYPIEYNPHQN